MAPKKLVFAKNGEENDKQAPNNAVEESSDEEGNSDSGGKALFVKFGENGSACSSPTASGFIIMPAVKPSGMKKKRTPSSKKFSYEDEIALLKGLAVFWANGRNNKWTEFHKFIKDDLTNQFSKIQVSEKIRALKKKFERVRANGGRLDFSDSHESDVFELSKALWGDEEDIAEENRKRTENEHEESNEKSRKKKQLNEHNEVKKKSRKREQIDGENKILEQGKEVDEHYEEENIPEKQRQVDEDRVPEKGKQVKEDFESDFPLLYASFDKFGFPKIAKEKCVLIPREKAQELEEMWRELDADALRLELKRIELIKRDLQYRLQTK